jgi:hypothetical protein
VFGSLAFLAFYRDWRVLVTASAVVAADHSRGPSGDARFRAASTAPRPRALRNASGSRPTIGCPLSAA